MPPITPTPSKASHRDHNSKDSQLSAGARARGRSNFKSHLLSPSTSWSQQSAVRSVLFMFAPKQSQRNNNTIAKQRGGHIRACRYAIYTHIGASFVIVSLRMNLLEQGFIFLMCLLYNEMRRCRKHVSVFFTARLCRTVSAGLPA